MKRPRVGLIGVSGYSRVHLEHLRAFQRSGEIELVAAVVIDAATEVETCRHLAANGCEVFSDFISLLQHAPRLRLDLCIVPSPIHLHTAHAVGLLRAGVNVLVEKPLAGTVGEVDLVQEAARTTGRRVAVGFQYLHAAEVHALKARLLAGELGELQRITATVSWPRSHSYYGRSDWAGRLRLGQGWVLDSPVANAMAHFFMLLLYFAGDRSDSGATIQWMSAELYRAQKIESFDTAALSMRTTTGRVLEFYGTHSSRDVVRPRLTLIGSRGQAEWVQDSHAVLENPRGSWHQPAASEALNRERMLRDVLAYSAGANRFVCSPELAREHVRCVNALHVLGRIVDIPSKWRAEYEADQEVFSYVPDLGRWLHAAAAGQRTLCQVGAPWAEKPVEMNLEHFGGLTFAPATNS